MSPTGRFDSVLPLYPDGRSLQVGHPSRVPVRVRFLRVRRDPSSLVGVPLPEGDEEPVSAF